MKRCLVMINALMIMAIFTLVTCNFFICFINTFSFGKKMLHVDRDHHDFHQFIYSHAFGFGLMDAGKMVERAEKWEKVPQQEKCSNEYNGGNK